MPYDDPHLRAPSTEDTKPHPFPGDYIPPKSNERLTPLGDLEKRIRNILAPQPGESVGSYRLRACKFGQYAGQIMVGLGVLSLVGNLFGSIMFRANSAVQDFAEVAESDRGIKYRMQEERYSYDTVWPIVTRWAIFSAGGVVVWVVSVGISERLRSKGYSIDKKYRELDPETDWNTKDWN